MTERTKPAPHGWIILDKPRGLGSTQAVGAVKRVLRQGGYHKTKVGHGGTLDPLAEGVLPIALGEGTKIAGRMLDSDKIYAFTIQFGEETDTLDTEGEVADGDNPCDDFLDRPERQRALLLVVEANVHDVALDAKGHQGQRESFEERRPKMKKWRPRGGMAGGKKRKAGRCGKLIWSFLV